MYAVISRHKGKGEENDDDNNRNHCHDFFHVMIVVPVLLQPNPVAGGTGSL